MTTNTQDHDQKAPWWEKLTDASTDTDKGQGLVKKVLIVAIVLMVAYFAWDFFQDTKTSGQDELALELGEAAALLPDAEQSNYGEILDPEFMTMDPRFREMMIQRGMIRTLASEFYRGYSPNTRGVYSALSAFTDPDTASAYLDEAERKIGDLEDKASRFSKDPEWEWRYLHVLQQLHYFASINSADFANRMAHLKRQSELLEQLKADHAERGVLPMKPFEKDESTVLELWIEANKGELDYYAKAERQQGVLTVEPDANLRVNIELDNGGKIVLQTYSRTATKAVQNFLDHARNGRYDGTAAHRVDQAAGVIEFGSVLTKLAPDRRFVWGNEGATYMLPSEVTPLLPIKRGSVTTKVVADASGHPLFFEIHVSEPANQPPNDTVFAEVIEGMEILDEWLQTKVHDEMGVAARLIPTVRLGIKKVVVEGEVDHKGDDSWTPRYTEPTVPAVNGLEKQFEEALAAKDEQLPEGDGDNKPEENGEDG